MKSGSVAVAKGDLASIESTTYTVEEQGFEVTLSLDIKHSVTDLSGEVVARQGIAAQQEVTEGTDVEVGDDGSIAVGSIPQLVWNTTEFLISPEGFIITDTGSGQFLYDILKAEFGVEAERASINLRSLQNEFEDQDRSVEPWKVGFYGREANADNGVVHGVDVLNDDRLGNILAGTAMNQLGLVFDRDGFRMKVFVTESGYVEVYQPSDFDTTSFVDWVSEEVIPHVRTEF